MYEVVNKKTASACEGLPRYFLAGTPGKAEAMFGEFEKTLNAMASQMAWKTGLEKEDLFGEGVLALATAVRDWNPKNGGLFKTYAIYRIKDALREYAEANGGNIRTPAYIARSWKHVCAVDKICEAYGADGGRVVDTGTIPDEFSEDDAYECVRALGRLIRASIRARVDYGEFVKRVRLSKFSEEENSDSLEFDPRMDMEIFVSQLKSRLSVEENEICSWLEAGETLEEIGRRIGISTSGAHARIKGLREKMRNLMERDA